MKDREPKTRAALTRRSVNTQDAVAVLQRAGKTDLLLQVARVSNWPTAQSSMMLCEILGASTIQIGSDDALKELPQTTISTDYEVVRTINWNICAYRRPKSGKMYQHLPETLLVGSVPDTQQLLCYTKSFLSGTCLNNQVKNLLGPIYAGIHGIAINNGPTGWKPPLIRQSTTSLRDRVANLATTCLEHKSDPTQHVSITLDYILSSDSGSLSTQERQPRTGDKRTTVAEGRLLMLKRDPLEDDHFEKQRASCLQNSSLRKKGEFERHREVERDHEVPDLVPAVVLANLQVNAVQQTSNVAPRGGFISLPQEIVDQIIDHVLDSDLLCRITNLDGSESSTSCPHILLVNKSLRDSGIKRLYRQELVIHSESWLRCNVIRQPLLRHIRRAAVIRVDFSNIKFRADYKRDLSDFLSWLKEILKQSSDLKWLILFTPPHYRSLPDLEPDHYFHQEVSTSLVDPVKAMLPDLKEKWDPTDFNNGDCNPLGLSVIENKVLVARVSLARSSRECINQITPDGRTLLTRAMRYENLEIFNMLLRSESIDVNEPDAFEDTPLVLASRMGLTAVVEIMLLHKELLLDKRERIQGKTAMQIAKESGHDEIVHLLQAKGALE